MDAHEQCVYVKAAVLAQLERDKRGLKWELARTSKLADTRAADVTACEAKVTDLLTIVELNKTVADRAVKRAYSHESALQRTARERDDLQQRLLQQRQQFIERALHHLQQRIARRHQRAVLCELASHIAWRRRVRSSLHRVVALRSHVRTAIALSQWKRVCSTLRASAALRVQPLQSPLLHASAIATATAARTQAFATASLSSSSLSSTLVVTTAATLQQRIAQRWCDTRCARRILQRWQRCVRSIHQQRAWRNRQTQRTLQRIIRTWRLTAQTTRRQRFLLKRVVQTTGRRVCRQWFTRLRLQCVTHHVVEWTRVLDAARAALSDEQHVAAMHYNAALQELHARIAQHTKSVRASRTQRVRQRAALQRKQRLCQSLIAWRAFVTLQQLCSRVAVRFQHIQHRRRILRRCWRAWVCQTTAQTRRQQQRRAFTHTRQRRIEKIVLLSWAALVWNTRLKRQRLRALVHRSAHVQLLQRWLQWRHAIALDDVAAAAALVTRRLNQQLQQQQQQTQHERVDTIKQRKRLQLLCALARCDNKRKQQMRCRMQQWAARVRLTRQRCVVLRRILHHCAVRLLQQSVLQWRVQIQQLTTIDATLDRLAAARAHRCVVMRFQHWHRRTLLCIKQRAQLQRTCLVFARWRDAHRYRYIRSTVLRRVVGTYGPRAWQTRAFRRWRQQTNAAATSETQRKQDAFDAVQRVWRRWCLYRTHRLRRRCRQCAAVTATLELQQRLMLQRSVLRCWWLLVKRCRMAALQCNRLCYRRHAMSLLQTLIAWRTAIATTQQQRNLLLRLVQRIATHAMRVAWTRWRVLVVWNTTKQTLQDATRHRLVAFARRRATQKLLQHVLHDWRKRRCVGASARRTLQRLFERRAARLRCGALTRAFERWQQVLALHALCIEMTVSRILLDEAHERAHALERAAHTNRLVLQHVAAWRRFVAACRVRRHALWRIIRRLTMQQKRLAWRRWRSCVASCKRVQFAAQTLGTRLRRYWMRIAWRLWQRHNARAVLTQAAQEGDRRSKALVRATLQSIALRRQQRSQQQRAFLAWRQCVAHRKHRSECWRCVVAACTRTRCSMRLTQWRAFVLQRRTCRALVACIARRQARRALSSALHRWRDHRLIAAHAAALVVTRQVLQQRCSDTTMRAARALCRSAMRRCVAVLFTHWCALTSAALAQRRTALQQCVHRQLTRSMAHVLRRWQAFVERKRLRTAALARVATVCQRAHVRTTLCRWRQQLEQQRRAVSSARTQRIVLLQLTLTCWRSRVHVALQRKLYIRTAQQRIAQRRQQRLMRHWRAVATHIHTLRRSIDRLQCRTQQRRVRTLWRSWCIAVQWTRAARCRQALEQQLHKLQQRSAMTFVRVVAAVVTLYSLRRAFQRWRRDTTVLLQLQTLLQTRQRRLRAASFQRWRCAAVALHTHALYTQQQQRTKEHNLRLYIGRRVQRLRRSVLLHWHVQTQLQQRKQRSVSLLLQLLAFQRARIYRIVTRCCWTHWRLFVTQRRSRSTTAQAMHRRYHHRLQHDALRCWRAVLVRKRFAGRLLASIARQWRRRLLTHSWSRWTRCTADAGVTLAHAKLVILELEHWNATCRHALDRVVARAFVLWQRAAAATCAFRTLQLVRATSRRDTRLLRTCVAAWRNVLRRREQCTRQQQQPVLCIQLRPHGRAPYYVSYRTYKTKLQQTRWRVAATRTARRSSSVHLQALTLLLVAIGRQHKRVLQRAFWRWFATIQTISSALAAIAFHALPWRSARTNIAGSMLLLVLEELHHVQQARGMDQRVARCAVLAAIARGLQRRRLQRAFDHMVCVTAHARQYNSSNNRASRRAIGPHGRRIEAAAVRAGTQTLAALLLRRAFRDWKQQYVAAALRSAETAQLELLHALRDVSSYRQTLDPYAVPY